MTRYILYHGNCPDGFGAAFAAWLRFGDDAEYIPVNYGKEVPDMLTGETEVYILDFSYPTKIINQLITMHCKVVVLDHHHTAKMELESLMEEMDADPYLVRFDMNKSGAVMAWEYFHKEPVPEFFLYLQDRDLWHFKLPQSREVSMALRSYPYDFKKWSQISALVQQGQIYELPGIMLDDLKKQGVHCRRLTEQQVENMARNHRFFEFRDCCDSSWSLEPTTVKPCRTELGYVVPVANASVFFSEVGEKLLEMYPDAPFSAYYSDRSDGKRQWGLRSREGFDCSVIARHFGGGGHKAAAGFVEDTVKGKEQ